MKAVNFFLIFLVFCFSAEPVRAGNQLYFEQGLTGLPNHIEGNMVRDKDGILWFCYYGGIARYDGYEVKYFSSGSDMLSGPATMSIVEDEVGRLWILTKDNGLTGYDKRTNTFTHYKHNPADSNSLASNSSDYFAPQRLYAASNNLLLIGTNSGLDLLELDTLTFRHFKHDPGDPNSLSHNNVTAVIEDGSGVFWIGTAGGGLNSFDPETEKWQRFSHTPGDMSSLSSNMVWSLLQDSRGVIWVGTLDNGLNKLDKDTGRFTRFIHDPDNPASIADNKVFYLYEDSMGDIWLTHRESKVAGLEKFNPESGQFVRFRYEPTKRNSVSSNSVSTVYEDPVSGILWVLNTYKGIFDKVDRKQQKFKLYQHDLDDPGSIYSSQVAVMHEDTKGRFWVSTKGSLDLLDRKTGVFKHHPYAEISPSIGSFIAAIHEDDEGFLWMVDFGKLGSLIKLDPETVQLVKQYQHLPGDPGSLMVHTMPSEALIGDRDDPDIIWIGLSSGLEKFNKRTETFTHYVHDPTNPETISKGTVWTVWDDGKGYLWVSTFGGLSVLDKKSGKFKQYIHNPEDSQTVGFSKLTSVFEDSRNNLWVTGLTDGIDKFDREKTIFYHFNRRTGFPATGVNHTIQEDDNGYLWIGTTDAGLFKFNIETEEVERIYTISDGLHGNYLWRSYKTRDGTLWFSGPAGLNSFRPEDIMDNPYVPPVVLTSFSQGGVEVETGVAPELLREVILDWRNNFFEFQFAALNYTKPEKNRYSYMLEGRDTDWYDSGNTPRGRYTGLTGGNYILKMRGSNNDGVWNTTGAVLKIKVTPPFWRSPAFYGLLLFAGFFTALIIILYIRRLHREIAERLKAETELRLNEENLRTTLNSIGDGVIATDTQGMILRMNRAAEQLTGWSKAEAINKPLCEVLVTINSATRAIEDNAVTRVMKTGQQAMTSNSLTVISRDGSEYRVADSGSPILSDNGQMVGIVMALRDITEEIALQEQLQHSQKMDAIGQLAGGVAHDFNNLLSGIAGAADLLKMHIKDDGKNDKYLDMILESTERAADLTRKLLSFSRKQQPASSAMGVHEVIENTVLLLESTIDRRIQIQTSLNAKSDRIIGDPSQLHSTFLNLGINASHAMPTGGIISISTREVTLDGERDENEKFPVKPGGFLRIEIQDTGTGIAPENLQRIFDPFFTTKKQGKGTGLGLSTVLSTIQQHGGDIQVQSEVGVGTTFTIHLPLTDEIVLHGKENDEARYGSGRILVVEDEPIMRATARSILEQLGYEVLVAEDGEAGLALYKEKYKDIDMVLLDMVMPKLNGHDCFLAMQEVNPDVRVVLSSGLIDNEDIMELQAIGIYGCIMKPYRSAALSRIVHDCMSAE